MTRGRLFTWIGVFACGIEWGSSRVLQRAGVIDSSHRKLFDTVAACAVFVLAMVLTHTRPAEKNAHSDDKEHPYRSNEQSAHHPTPEVPPVKRQEIQCKTPFLWNLRVWWAARKMSFAGDKLWTVKFTDAYGKALIMSCPWSVLADMAEECASVIAGEAYANRLADGRVWLVSPACVPTLAREAKKAAVAYSKLPPKTVNSAPVMPPSIVAPPTPSAPADTLPSVPPVD